ncbi:hypothetical protein AD951_07670 [Acetobacter malorum]|uniref:Replication protein n=1 Tax=Acetobacter malorum TaxID=178901 RepID=A0A149UMJ3_9PROT|nr:hypothetical protein [Acetobacter malorum]KXV69209.1 hypothetical protein AD951_07670 [Acetobacter malorum]
MEQQGFTQGEFAPPSAVAQTLLPGQGYLAALSAVQDASPVVGYLAARLNVDVTRAGLSLSCRAFLSALLDKLRISPSSWGTLTVTLSTEECADLLGMSKSARCEARRLLIATGFIAVNGRVFDLRPWAMRVMGEMPLAVRPLPKPEMARPEFGKGPEFGRFAPCNVSFNKNNNITVKTVARESPDFAPEPSLQPEIGTYDADAHRAELFDAIQLSDRLSSALVRAFGDRLDHLDGASLAVACGAIIGSVMPGLHRPRETWGQAVQTRGADAVLGLVAALEDTSVRNAEAWFAAYARGFGGFSSFEDIRPNLHAIRKRREAASMEKAESDAARQAQEQRKMQEDAIKRGNGLVEETLDALEAEGLLDSNSLVRLECEKAIRFSPKIGDNGGIYLRNLYQNRHAATIKDIAFVVSERTGLCLMSHV